MITSTHFRPRSLQFNWHASLIVGSAVLTASAHAQAPSIIALPPLQGTQSSLGQRIMTRQDGMHIVHGRSWSSPTSSQLLTRWIVEPGGGPAGPGTLISTPSSATDPWVHAASSSGLAAVGRYRPTGSSTVPVLWTGTSHHVLPIPAGTPSNEGEATGISGDGSIIVGRAWTTGVRWVNGIITDTAPGFRSGPMNADGSLTLGHTVVDNQFHLSRWTAAGVEPLAAFPWSISTVLAMTPDGDAAIGHRFSGQNLRSWIYREGSITDMGIPAGMDSIYAGGISNGHLAVGTGYAGTTVVTTLPFVWTPQGGWIEFGSWLAGQGIEFPDWTFYELMSLSEDGRSITGGGRDPSGQYRAFIVTIPAPGPAALALTTLGFALARRRR
jgi:hypothetical protein